jgi:hypothetical protein
MIHFLHNAAVVCVVNFIFCHFLAKLFLKIITSVTGKLILRSHLGQKCFRTKNSRLWYTRDGPQTCVPSCLRHSTRARRYSSFWGARNVGKIRK